MQRATILIGAAGLALVAALSACSSSGGGSGAAVEGRQSQQIQSQYEKSQPLPEFKRSELRDQATLVEAIQALGEPTETLFYNLGVEQPIFSCPSLGEPIASTTQISNPQQLIKDTNPNHSNSTAATLDNMEPNGVYTGDSTGTYVICVTDQGEPYSFYWEGFVAAVSRSAHWDSGSKQIITSGNVRMPVCKLAKNAKGKLITSCVKD